MRYANKDYGLFRIGKKVHKNPDPCYMTAMNSRVYKLTGVVNFAWFDDGNKADYYLAEGNFWD